MLSSLKLPGAGRSWTQTPDNIADFADTLLDPERHKLFFGDDLHHFCAPYLRENPQLLPTVKAMVRIFAHNAQQTGANDHLVFKPEAITSGQIFIPFIKKREEHIHSKRNGRLSGYRLADILDKGDMKPLVMRNAQTANADLNAFQRRYPNMPVISPNGLEPVLKIMQTEKGFTGAQAFRDEHFEAFWVMLCYLSRHLALSRDANDSRNGGFEIFAMMAAHYGMLPFRTQKGGDILLADGNKGDPLLVQKMYLDHLSRMAENGITSEIALTMSLRIAMMEDMLRGQFEHPDGYKPDLNTIHPSLPHKSETWQEEMQNLRDRILELADAHSETLWPDPRDPGFHVWNADGVPDYAAEKLSKLRQWKRPRHDKAAIQETERLELRKRLFPQPPSLYWAGPQASGTPVLPYAKPGGLGYFGHNSQPEIFADQRYARLDEKWQITARLFLGMWHTTKKPTTELGTVLIIGDRRGGQLAQDFAAQQGQKTGKDARGAQSALKKYEHSSDGADFETAVTSQNQAYQESARLRVARDFPGHTIVTSEDIDNQISLMETLPGAVRARGAAKPPALFKTGLTEELMRADGVWAMFTAGWPQTDKGPETRVAARLLQLGLTSRPAQNRHHLTVFDLPRAEDVDTRDPVEAGFGGDLAALESHLRQITECGDKNPAVLKTAIQTMALMRLYYYPPFNRDPKLSTPEHDVPLVDWEQTPYHLVAELERNETENKARMRAMRQFIFEEKLLHWLNPEELSADLPQFDPGYFRKWFREQADFALQTARDRPSGHQIALHGGVASPR